MWTSALGSSLRLVLLVSPLVLCAGTGAPAPAQDWRQFGGPGGTFELEAFAPEASAAAAGEIAAWGTEGPQELWRRPAGSGYSSPVADEKRVVVFYRPRVADGQSRSSAKETVALLDATTGAERWRHEYAAPMRDGHLEQFGLGPHATPLLLEDRVITLGYTGELRALSLDDGEVIWRTHLLDDHGGEVTSWGFSASPLLWNGDVVVPVGGGKAGLIAFDPETGAQSWASPPTSVSYAMPVLVDVFDQEQIVYFAADALHSVEPGTGRPLWSTPIENGYRNHASMPIFLPPDRLWVVSQQEAAARMLRLRRSGEDWSVETEWTNGRVRAHHWNSLVVRDQALVSTGDSVQMLSGVDLANGEILWRDRAVGKANLLRVGEQVLALDEDGTLFLLRPTEDGVRVEAQAELLGSPSWTAPTLVGSTLYLRDEKEVVALRLERAPSGASAAAEP